MMAIAVVVGVFTGRIDAVTEAAIDMAKTAVEISIGLIGIMARPPHDHQQALKYPQTFPAILRWLQ